MGSCASSQNKHVASSSPTNLKQSFGSKMEINMAVPPPTLAATNEDVAKGHRLEPPPPSPSPSTTTLGDYANDSKSDAFFESQAWLESDCEDDFFSVRGDLTPFANTPLHQNTFKPTPPANLLNVDSKAFDSIPEPPSSANEKKKLSELFRDSTRENQGGGGGGGYDQYAPFKPIITANEKSECGLTFADFFPKLKTAPPYVPRSKSVHVIQRGGGDCIKENKDVNGNKCCLPVMLSCGSFREKKRMRHVIHGKA